MIKDLYSLSAEDALIYMAAGKLTSVELVQSCLDRIAKTDETIKAWKFLDPETALAKAEECDKIRKAGLALGSLHGIPIGLQDNIDTAKMPTACDMRIITGHSTHHVARLVEHLQEAGAVIIGKTVTTELAMANLSETCNPHNPERIAGGSSSGSAAAVAAQHVPLAIGTQTNGSVIRSASYCGIFGFKPTRGVISRTGILQSSISLDQVGCFGRNLREVALLTNAISSYDQNDTASFSHPRPDMEAGANAIPPVTPNLAWLNLPYNNHLTDAARAGFDEIFDILKGQLTQMPPTESLSNLIAVHNLIHEYEVYQHQNETFNTHSNQIGTNLKPAIARARQITKTEYKNALAIKSSAEEFFAYFFTEFDAIIAPATSGEAPYIGLSTSDPIFSTLGTLSGLPCVTMPLLVGETNLPIGVQLIGPREKDDRLLRTARWLQTHLVAEAE